MRALPCLLTAALVACGGGASAPPDAPTEAPDAAAPSDGAGGGDATLDAAGPPAGCDYQEQRDATNDDVPPATGSPEATGLVFATRTVLCGTFESAHFDGDITVDIDGYVLDLAADADVLVRLDGAALGSIEYAGIDVYGGPTFGRLAGTSTAVGAHGVTALHLAAGRYELDVFALASAAIPAPVPYRVEVVTDAPATRCPAPVTAGYTEAHDGPTSTGNDVLSVPSGAPPALTANAADAPEPTGVVLGAAAPGALSGVTAALAAVDKYRDRDTFAVRTAAGTNELTIRLDWQGAGVDLDYLVLDADAPTPVLRATTTATAGPEVRTFAVKPGADYWIVVGATAASAQAQASYRAALCGAAYAP